MAGQEYRGTGAGCSDSLLAQGRFGFSWVKWPWWRMDRFRLLAGTPPRGQFDLQEAREASSGSVGEGNQI